MTYLFFQDCLQSTIVFYASYVRVPMQGLVES